MRSDLSDLRAEHPDLANRFESIRRALDNSYSKFGELEMGIDLNIERYFLSKELDT
jgi:hypothetical protein